LRNSLAADRSNSIVQLTPDLIGAQGGGFAGPQVFESLIGKVDVFEVGEVVLVDVLML
jgi:hypothetical protein